MTPQHLPDPPPPDEIHAWVADHLGDLCAPQTAATAGSPRGGQTLLRRRAYPATS